MREIKFRAWITGKMSFKSGKPYMFYQDDQYLGSFLSRANAQQFDNSGHDAYGTVELMQYTGLKDKNGTEIYEGDILKTDSKYGITEVTYINASFAIKIPRGKQTLGLKISKKSEVIGNIYENPELTKN